MSETAAKPRAPLSSISALPSEYASTVTIVVAGSVATCLPSPGSAYTRIDPEVTIARKLSACAGTAVENKSSASIAAQVRVHFWNFMRQTPFVYKF